MISRQYTAKGRGVVMKLRRRRVDQIRMHLALVASLDAIPLHRTRVIS